MEDLLNMILDLICIILASLTTIFKNDKFYKTIENITIGRYLDCKRKKDNMDNETIDVLSNQTAIDNVFLDS